MKTAAVQVGKKQDQMSMRITGSLGLSYEPLVQLVRFASTNSTNFANVNDPIFEAFYPQALAYTNVSDIKQVLIAANKYVAQQHFDLCLLQPLQPALAQPWVISFSGAKALAGGAAGITELGFYCSRYWLDQNLKKSLGY